MSSHINEEVIRMLKSGASPEMLKEVLKEERKAYSFVFVDFMQDMLKKYSRKRTDIARATGISQDYLYKVLNGQKKTSERDYIIAICLAIGMNVPETQHALEISQMPLLNDRDIREHILITCISENRGVNRTNEWLERINYPLLRVNRNMEQYVPKYDYSPELIDETLNRSKRHFKEIEREVTAEQCGNAPLDYIYSAKVTVEDENGDRFHVQGYYSPVNTVFSVTDENNFRKMEECQENISKEKPVSRPEPWTNLETYEELEDACESDFFRFFLEIDRITDEKVKEVLSRVDDTANYRMRCGIRSRGSTLMRYAELYDTGDPAKHQYFQVVEEGEHVTWSASHESVYMRMELGQLYPAVFGEKDEPKYFIQVTSADELMKLSMRERFILETLRTNMHAKLKDSIGDLIGIDDQTIYRESIESTAKAATWAFLHRQYEESLRKNLQLLEMAYSQEEQYGTDETGTILTTLSKIEICYSSMNDEENAETYHKKILDNKDRLNKALAKKEEGLNGAVQAYTEALLVHLHSLQEEVGPEEQLGQYREIIDLLGKDKAYYGAEETMFIACIKYAYILDELDRSDQAIEYYEKAERIVRKYHLEQGDNVHNVMSFYNNYAWVLWNRFENEEAIIYYGKAIELAEDYIDHNENDSSDAALSLRHFAEGLCRLYRQTGKIREENRLVRRLWQYNIDLSENR